MTTSRMTAQEVKEFRSIHKAAGIEIDPAEAEVKWEYGQPGDPYRLNPDSPDEEQQVGRVYFARSPRSDIWVWFGDLPETTKTVLWERHKERLAFPAGLPVHTGPS